jgi:hypothetical protein
MAKGWEWTSLDLPSQLLIGSGEGRGVKPEGCSQLCPGLGCTSRLRLRTHELRASETQPTCA